MRASYQLTRTRTRRHTCCSAPTAAGDECR
jgi:hypothetical protein